MRKGNKRGKRGETKIGILYYLVKDKGKPKYAQEIHNFLSDTVKKMHRRGVNAHLAKLVKDGFLVKDNFERYELPKDWKSSKFLARVYVEYFMTMDNKVKEDFVLGCSDLLKEKDMKDSILFVLTTHIYDMVQMMKNDPKKKTEIMNEETMKLFSMSAIDYLIQNTMAYLLKDVNRQLEKCSSIREVRTKIKEFEKFKEACELCVVHRIKSLNIRLSKINEILKSDDTPKTQKDKIRYMTEWLITFVDTMEASLPRITSAKQA